MPRWIAGCIPLKERMIWKFLQLNSSVARIVRRKAATDQHGFLLFDLIRDDL